MCGPFLADLRIFRENSFAFIAPKNQANRLDLGYSVVRAREQARAARAQARNR